MLVGGASQKSHRIGDLHMAPGLDLVPDVIIDQHFAERAELAGCAGYTVDFGKPLFSKG